MNSAEKAAQAAKKEQQDQIKRTFVKAEAIRRKANSGSNMIRKIRYKKAAKLYKECANAGHAESMGWLGNYYTYGWGENKKKGYYWFTKGAEAGDVASLWEFTRDGYGNSEKYEIKLKARLTALYKQAKKLLIQCVDNCSEYCDEFNVADLNEDDSALFDEASDIVAKCIEYDDEKFSSMLDQINEMAEEQLDLETLKRDLKVL